MMDGLSRSGNRKLTIWLCAVILLLSITVLGNSIPKIVSAFTSKGHTDEVGIPSICGEYNGKVYYLTGIASTPTNALAFVKGEAGDAYVLHWTVYNESYVVLRKLGETSMEATLLHASLEDCTF